MMTKIKNKACFSTLSALRPKYKPFNFANNTFSHHSGTVSLPVPATTASFCSTHFEQYFRTTLGSSDCIRKSNASTLTTKNTRAYSKMATLTNVTDLLDRQYKGLVTVSPDLTLDKAMHIMVMNNVHHLPVVTPLNEETKGDQTSSSTSSSSSSPSSSSSTTTKTTNVDEKKKQSEEQKQEWEPIGTLIGIVSDRDLRFAASSPFTFLESKRKKWTRQQQFEEMISKLHQHKVHEVMCKNVTTVNEDASIVEAAKLMRVGNIGAIPVVKNNTNLLIGMLTRADLIDHLIRLIEPFDPTKEGEEIEEIAPKAEEQISKS